MDRREIEGVIRELEFELEGLEGKLVTQHSYLEDAAQAVEMSLSSDDDSSELEETLAQFERQKARVQGIENSRACLLRVRVTLEKLLSERLENNHADHD
jgi:hypothetical protein